MHCPRVQRSPRQGSTDLRANANVFSQYLYPPCWSFTEHTPTVSESKTSWLSLWHSLLGRPRQHRAVLPGQGGAGPVAGMAVGRSLQIGQIPKAAAGDGRKCQHLAGTQGSASQLGWFMAGPRGPPGSTVQENQPDSCISWHISLLQLLSAAEPPSWLRPCCRLSIGVAVSCLGGVSAAIPREALPSTAQEGAEET